MDLLSNLRKNKLKLVLLLLVQFFIVWGHDADPGPILRNYSLFGEKYIKFNYRATTAEGGWIGSDSDVVFSGWDGQIKIQDQVKVGNNLNNSGNSPISYSDTVFVKGSVLGTPPSVLINPATFTDPSWPAFSAANINSDPANDKNGTNTLPPGRYGDITALETSMTITFSPGVYEIDNLEIGGKLIVNKAESEIVRILVKNNFRLRNYGGGQVVRSINDDDYGRILIYVAGDAIIDQGSRLDASLVAPNCDLSLKSEVTINGQVMARSITTENNFDGSKGIFVPFDPSKISLIGASTFFINEDGGDGDNSTIDSRLVNIPVELGGAMDSASSVQYEIRQITGNPELYAKDSLYDFSSYSNGATKADTLFFPAKSTTPTDSIFIWIVDDLLTDAGSSMEGDTEYFDLYLYNPQVALLENDANAYAVIDVGNDKIIDTLVYRIPIINDDFNQAPNAVIDTFYINEGDSVVLNVLANDSDPDGNPIVVSAISTKPVNADTAYISSGGITYIHNDQENIIDSLVYQISDQPAGETDLAKVIIIITPVSDQNPYSNPDNITVYEHRDTSTTSTGATSLFTNDTDPETGDIISFSKIIKNGSLGTMAIGTTGTFTYSHTSTSESVFLDTVVYEIKDNGNNLDTAFAYITVIPVNDNTPVGANYSDTVSEGQSISVSAPGLLTGATDADLTNNAHGLIPAEALSINIPVTKGASKGIFAPSSNGNFDYTANSEAYGIDTIIFTIADNGGHTSANCTLFITILPENDNSPVATNDSITVNENDSTSVFNSGKTTLLELVSDADLPNDNITITNVTNAAHGIFTLNPDNTFKYVNEGIGKEETKDSVIYTVQDAVGNTSTGTIYIKINLINDETPKATDNTINVDVPGGTQTILANGNSSVLDDDLDLDAGDTKTATLLDSTVNGTLTLNSDGTFTYVHVNLTNLIDSATYICEDGAGHKDTAKIYIGIALDFSTKPIANNDSIIVDEGKSIQILSNDSTSVFWNDNGNDILDKIKGFVISTSLFGTFTLDSASGTFIYNHDDSENFKDSIIYYIEDLDGLKDTATIYISINPINDNPPDPEVDTIYVDEGDTATILSNGNSSVLDNDIDLDKPYDSLTASLTDSTKDGSLILNSDGTFIYIHSGKENDFTDNFVYTVSDTAATPHTANQIVYIIINPVNDNDPIKDTTNTLVLDEGDTTTITADGDTSLLTDIHDPDFGDTLKIDSIIKIPDHGTFIITDSLKGTFILIHDGSENFTDTIIYVISDKAGNKILDTLIVTIIPVNDNIPVGISDSIIVDEGAVVSVLKDLITNTVLANDSDVDINTVLTASLLDTSGITQFGKIQLNSDGTFEYEHDDSENFTDSFAYIVSDGLFADTVTVYININPVNDNLTVVNPDTIFVIEGTTVDTLSTGETSVLINDTDIDGMGAVTAILVDKPLVGTVILNSDGTFEYTHNKESNVYTDYFTYVAIDGQDTTIETRVEIFIEAIPKPSEPILSGYYDKNGDGIIDSIHVEFNRPITLLKNDTAVTSFQIQWDNLPIVDLPVDSSNLSENGYNLDINIEGLFNVIKTGGQMLLQCTFTLYNPITENYYNTTVIGKISDKAAPVLTRAEYFFRDIENPDDPTNSDSLKFDKLVIDFSEDVGIINGIEPFNFMKNNSTNDLYTMELEQIILDSTKGIFKVLGLNGAFYPDSGDLVWIYSDTANYPSLYISDTLGNRQKVSDNRKVPLILDVPELDITVSILHIVGKTKPVIPDELKVGNISTGAVIVLTSENPGNTQEVIDHLLAARKRVGIYDLVGNEVISIDNDYNKHLIMGIKTVGGKPSLIINWDGMNSNGRIVATSSYVIIIRVTDDPMFQDKEVIKKVNIKQFISE